MTERSIERMRHDVKFRLATVTDVERITPKMARITLTSPDFANFPSKGFDDHCKVFLPEPGTQLATPTRSENGLVFPDGQRPQSRDYTPRSFDLAANTVVIDFVLHGDGPASSWAEQAKPGDTLGVGGPRGSQVVHGQWDWYLLVGDETALPAISRRLEELHDDAKVFAVIEVADEAEKQTLTAPANTSITWVLRNGAGPDAERLLDAVKALDLPAGDGLVFAAAEARAARAVKTYMIEERGHNPEWVKASGYWQAGESDFHDHKH